MSGTTTTTKTSKKYNTTTKYRNKDKHINNFNNLLYYIYRYIINKYK